MKKLFLTTFSLVIALSAMAEEIICFEAESGQEIVAPVAIVAGEPAESVSGGKIVEVKQGAGEGKKVGGSISYSIELAETGNYYLWARVWWLDGCGNSFSVKFNDGPTFAFGNDNTFKNWHWVKARVRLKLEAGTHTIVVSNREDGIKIDQFLLTDDRAVVPVGIETITVEMTGK
jgi:hypothetical protein